MNVFGDPVQAAVDGGRIRGRDNACQIPPYAVHVAADPSYGSAHRLNRVGGYTHLFTYCIKAAHILRLASVSIIHSYSFEYSTILQDLSHRQAKY